MTPLKYAVVESQLKQKKNPDDCRAVTTSVGTHNEKDLVELMVKYNSSMTEADINGVFTVMKTVIENELVKGYGIKLPLFNISLSVAGIFNGTADTFDKERHHVKLKLTKGTALRAIENSIKLERTDVHDNIIIREVKNNMTGVANNTLTKAGVIEIIGKNIKIGGTDKACGLWFIGEDKTETKAEYLMHNTTVKILAQIPVTAPGTYMIKIVTQYMGKKSSLKVPKQYLYKKTLTIE